VVLDHVWPKATRSDVNSCLKSRGKTPMTTGKMGGGGGCGVVVLVGGGGGGAQQSLLSLDATISNLSKKESSSSETPSLVDNEFQGLNQARGPGPPTERLHLRKGEFLKTKAGPEVNFWQSRERTKT